MQDETSDLMQQPEESAKGDKFIWGIYIALFIISVIEMFSASSKLTYGLHDYFTPTLNHVGLLVTGLILLLIFYYIPYKYFKGLMFAYPLSIVLLVVTIFYGEDINGAKRQIEILGFSLQASEFAKLGVITIIAYLLSLSHGDKEASNKAFLKILAAVVLACGFIMPENLSTALLLAVVSYAMMFIGGIDWKRLVGLAAVVITLLVMGYFVTKTLPEYMPDRAVTWVGRVDRFLSGNDIPIYSQETTDDNYQEHHARMAIANGGYTGVFVGNSVERDFLPLAFSDFIYAIIIEEWGLLGGLFVMALYISLLVRAAIVASRCSRSFLAFLMLGVAMMIVLQALIHMVVAVGLGPVTGQPLPLISKGGTSIWVTSIYFGILLNISKYTVADQKKMRIAKEKSENTVSTLKTKNNE